MQLTNRRGRTVHTINDKGEKRCTKCKEFKPLSEFIKDETKPGGFRHACKVCVYDARRKREAKKIIDEPVVKEHIPLTRSQMVWVLGLIRTERKSCEL